MKKLANRVAATKGIERPSGTVFAQTDATIAGHFRETIRQLDIVEQHFRDGADPLLAALNSIFVVKELIETDLGAQANGSTRSIDQLMNAIRDTLQGGKPELFKQRSKKGGRPSRQSVDAIKGTVAACFQVLRDAGVDAPATKVASYLKELGIRMPIAGDEGKTLDKKRSSEITAKQISRWVRDIGEYAAFTATGIRDQILSGWREAQTLKLNVTPERFVRDCIKGLKSRGF